MTESDYHRIVARKDLDAEGPGSRRPTPYAHATSLRGSPAISVGRRFWRIASTIGLVLFALAIAVSFVSAASDNARIERMKAHGISVTVTVVDCLGNIGGSGSNAAGYTCRGAYVIAGTTYRELIGSMSGFAAPGARVRGVVDPSRHSTVELASAVSTSTASSGAYVIPGVLAIVLVALALATLRVSRRARSDAGRPTN